MGHFWPTKQNNPWQSHRSQTVRLPHRKKTKVKIIKTLAQLTLAIVLAASIHFALGQPGPGGGAPPDDDKFPMLPIIRALDTNYDGKLSADELLPRLPNGQKFTLPDGGKFPVLPNMKALDTNVDGELDANEIANAPAALKTLDKNTDGKLTWDEYMSPPPTDLDGNDGPPPGRQ